MKIPKTSATHSYHEIKIPRHQPPIPETDKGK